MGDYGIRACFDESGKEPDQGYCVVAGLVGTVEQWERFETTWGPYGIKTPFHAHSFCARDGGDRVNVYRGWSDNRAGEYFGALLRAIGNAEIDPVVEAVDWRAFSQFSAEQREVITGMHFREVNIHVWGASTKPYYWAFAQALMRTMKDQGLK